MTQRTLKRALGPVALTFYGIGMIVGAGIYSVIGAAAGEAGAGLWMSFLLGAVAAFLTGLSYAELATMFPEAGAEYIYAHRAFPRHNWPAFITGFLLSVAAAATAATVSLAFGGYLREFLAVPIWISAGILLILATALNITGIREASWVNILFTSAEVSGLILIIMAALRTDRFGQGVWQRPETSVLTGAALIFFVYLGFEEIANLAEETKKPEKTVPRAIFLSLVITTILYVLVAVAVIALTSPQRLAASNAPLSDAVKVVWPNMGGVLAAVALVSTANTGLISLIAGSRLLFGMGRKGDMPKVLGGVLKRRETPWAAALVVLGVALLLLPLGAAAATAKLSSFVSLVAFTMVNVALIVLRFRMPEHRRPFRVPLALGRFAVPPALGVLIAVGLLTQFDRNVYIAGFVAISLAFVAFWLYRRFAVRERS